MCPSVDISVPEGDVKKDVDESLLALLLLLSLLEELGKKLLSSTTSSSGEDDDDDAVELSSVSELKSSSCETQMLVYFHVICCQICQSESGILFHTQNVRN